MTSSFRSYYARLNLIIHAFSFFSMPYCAPINLTNTDLNYLRKIYFEKSWTWWVNHIGENTFDCCIFRITSDFYLTGTFLVFGIGFCGNILCLCVLCRRRKFENAEKNVFYSWYLALIRSSYTQYLIALAIFDTGAICSESN